GEIEAVREELRDRFGPLPEDAQRLLLISELRALGARVGLGAGVGGGGEGGEGRRGPPPLRAGREPASRRADRGARRRAVRGRGSARGASFPATPPAGGRGDRARAGASSRGGAGGYP